MPWWIFHMKSKLLLKIQYTFMQVKISPSSPSNPMIWESKAISTSSKLFGAILDRIRRAALMVNTPAPNIMPFSVHQRHLITIIRDHCKEKIWCDFPHPVPNYGCCIYFKHAFDQSIKLLDSKKDPWFASSCKIASTPHAPARLPLCSKRYINLLNATHQKIFIYANCSYLLEQIQSEK